MSVESKKIIDEMMQKIINSEKNSVLTPIKKSILKCSRMVNLCLIIFIWSITNMIIEITFLNVIH